MCPLGGRLMDGRTRGLGPARLVCHCLLIETTQGLVLVDTGIGVGDIAAPYPRLSRSLMHLLRVQLRAEETALYQVEARGFRGSDVRHIVLTHLDFDHAGGLEDFPYATVHLLGREREAALARSGAVGQRRYRPEQWDEVESWVTYEPRAGEPWFGFQAVRELRGLPPEILLVPLIGHTPGHCGIAVQVAGGWLLHAGDAYFFEGEVDPSSPRTTPGLSGYQRLMEIDRPARLGNQARLRSLVREHGREVTVMCAHDAAELDRLAPVVHTGPEWGSLGEQPSAPVT
jgi:glyoxylase-like metal-dependent hydrolase (beta-lactamase superfamily II)